MHIKETFIDLATEPVDGTKDLYHSVKYVLGIGRLASQHEYPDTPDNVIDLTTPDSTEYPDDYPPSAA